MNTDIDGIIVVKKTRDAIIIQEGEIMKKYVLEKEWPAEERKRVCKKKSDDQNHVAEPSYVAVANAMPKCTVVLERIFPSKNGEQKEQVEKEQRKICEMGKIHSFA